MKTLFIEIVGNLLASFLYILDGIEKLVIMNSKFIILLLVIRLFWEILKTIIIAGARAERKAEKKKNKKK